METNLFFAILGLFGLGILHGVGPDHLAALGTLATREGGLRAASRISFRFGLGHAAFLALGAIATWVVGKAAPELIPASFERLAELFGGSVVALLGILALFDAFGPRVHRHRDDGEEGGLHVHLGPGHRHEHRYSKGAFMVGAVLAVSGLRGLLLLLPAAATGSVWVLTLAVIAFGAGVIASMMGAALAGAGLAYVGSAAGLRLGTRLVRGMVGVASLAIGVGWIVTSW